jgi:hypothetical protein
VKTLFWNIDVFHEVYRCCDDFFAPVRAKIQIARKIEIKSLEETSIVLGSVEPLCPKNFLPVVGPAVRQEINAEKFLVRGWNVLQEGEDTSNRMFISQSIEYESVFGCESVSVFRNPAFNLRLDAPR